jgi:peptidoglycan/xylan/chitin deacetylase (PgdA/CDA1 family)
VCEVGDSQDATPRCAPGRVAPLYFRAGTAHYDDVAGRIVQDLGLLPVGSDLLGDGGATFTAAQVAAELERAQAGSIVLLHMNHPESRTVDAYGRPCRRSAIVASVSSF